LIQLNLPTFKYRLVTGKHDSNIEQVLSMTMNNNTVTRGNVYKLITKTHYYDLRKFCFVFQTVVNIWDSLPNTVVDDNSINLLRSRLARLWNQDVRDDYKTELIGTGEWRLIWKFK